jgi:hypothetical protein
VGLIPVTRETLHSLPPKVLVLMLTTNDVVNAESFGRVWIIMVNGDCAIDVDQFDCERTKLAGFKLVRW